MLAGQNVLITGIGGGVALTALQLWYLFSTDHFCTTKISFPQCSIAKGANVYVTSGSQIKIQKAKALGARQGFDYMNGKRFDGLQGTDMLIGCSFLDSFAEEAPGVRRQSTGLSD